MAMEMKTMAQSAAEEVTNPQEPAQEEEENLSPYSCARLEKTIVVGPSSHYVYCQKDLMFVASSRGVIYLKNGQARSLATFNNSHVVCLRTYHGHVYLLYNDFLGRWYVRKYKFSGELLKSWQHEDSSTANCIRHRTFAIYNDIVYVPSGLNECIKCYNMSGEEGGADINLTITNIDACICVVVAPKGKLIVMQYDPSAVICIDLKTRNQIWKNEYLVEPRGLTLDNCGRILVVTGGIAQAVTMWLLNAASGEVVDEILHGFLQDNDNVLIDIAVSKKDILFVPHVNQHEVQFYKLLRMDKKSCCERCSIL